MPMMIAGYGVLLHDDEAILVFKRIVSVLNNELTTAIRFL